MRPLLLLVLTCAAFAQDAPPRILGHDLTLTIDPKTSSFECDNRVRLEGTGLPDLGILEGVTATVVEDKPVGSGREILVRYTGRVRSTVEITEARAWLANETTVGFIGEQGSYLARGFFVPSKQPCRFRITIHVPAPHKAVSVGRRVQEREGSVTYECGYAIDGIVVMTGPWVVDEKVIDGVTCRTYLLEKDRKHKQVLLESLEVEIPRFQKMLGLLPDRRFDVIESSVGTSRGASSNFAAFGRGYLRWVCKYAARLGPHKVWRGSRSLVHCWLGSYVPVAYERGNWSEGLTWYLTELGSAEPGKDAFHRTRHSRGLSLRVGSGTDRPLRKFTRRGFDHVNQAKASMVFHMLARELGGRDVLIRAVRDVIEKRDGTRLGWDDLVERIGAATGRDLKPWFEPWLSRSGAPILQFGRIKVKGKRIVGTIVQAQDGDPYDLHVPVRVTTEAGVEEHVVRSGSKESLFVIDGKSTPKRLELDPDHHVLRVVPREHLAPSLDAVLTAERRVGFGHKELLRDLNVPVVEPSLPADAAVLVIGLDKAVRDAVIAGARRQDATLKVGEKSFEFRGEIYDRPGDAILMSYARRASPGLPVTFFHGNGEAALTRVTDLRYYDGYGWVVFRDGKLDAFGRFPGDRLASANISRARRGDPEPLVRDLLWLTDSAHKGRAANAIESLKLANELRGRLHVAGLKVHAWPAAQIAGGLCDAERILARQDGSTPPTKDQFYPFHDTATVKGPLAIERVVEHPADDAKGALVLVPEDASDEVVRRYAEQGAAAVAVVSKDDAFTARGHEAAWEGALPPSVAESFKKAGVKDVARAVSEMMGRSLKQPLPIPHVYISPKLAADLRKSKAAVTLRFKIQRTIQDVPNIVATFGNGREPGILLSAHWDGAGVVDGKVQASADGAAGVAVVLWVAEQLERDHEAGRLKRAVTIALFGGEESGLWGSRQFAALMRTAQSPVTKPLAAVNMNRIGAGHVELVPSLGELGLRPDFERASKGSSLVLLGEIPLMHGQPRDLYLHSSAHGPLIEAGVSAITINCVTTSWIDRLDKVDMGLVRETAKVVYRMIRDLATRDS